jgi:hypothetical protein
MTKRLSWHGPAVAWQDGSSPSETRRPLGEEEELEKKLPTRDARGFRSMTAMIASMNAINEAFWKRRPQ